MFVPVTSKYLSKSKNSPTGKGLLETASKWATNIPQNCRFPLPGPENNSDGTAFFFIPLTKYAPSPNITAAFTFLRKCIVPIVPDETHCFSSKTEVIAW